MLVKWVGKCQVCQLQRCQLFCCYQIICSLIKILLGCGCYKGITWNLFIAWLAFEASKLNCWKWNMKWLRLLWPFNLLLFLWYTLTMTLFGVFDDFFFIHLLDILSTMYRKWETWRIVLAFFEGIRSYEQSRARNKENHGFFYSQTNRHTYTHTPTPTHNIHPKWVPFSAPSRQSSIIITMELIRFKVKKTRIWYRIVDQFCWNA